ncbi:MAG: formate/nitrite transporter family protein [Inconstantimicrobium porci]|uniref:Formate/nitrite transporter family protein n=1 Tax=Inconstantimicrobium porci TaxID=2652291 RepID=A0A7X2T209_9CLOT|nr:formate/nitrite transporter family protein [Inconstantimicrobium porci]MDD6770738.1 formate/nitrite transporter family protein [Inconstantimicrobium porci]MDY5913452.1 formate/nitrite transporter family protein [Inconstantimicrobium porci]MSR91740.1 formate/nitrite transporter family protein [Inconstantimicrobium porci]
MFRQEIDEVGGLALKKTKYIDESVFKYFALSAIAGFFVIIGIAIAYTTGGIFQHFGKMYGKLAVALTFSIALDLIYFAGSELFTGNCFILGVGLLEKKVTFKNVLKVLIVCYLGNFAGIALFAIIYLIGGSAAGDTLHFIEASAAAKVALTPMQSVFRGILCNFVVCLAVWICIRMKEETSRVIVIFWCIFAFCIAGYEHCIANLAVFFMALFAPGTSITLAGAATSTFWVTLGNIIGGGIFLAIPYWFVSNTKNKYQ